MAKSSNKRKNGKRVANNHAERLKRLQARDIVGLMVCNAVGTSEVKGDRNELTPRTCVYSLPKRNITTITSRQAQALKEQRWAWNIQFGIVCRKPDGEVYLEQEENAQLFTEVKLSEMNEFVTDKLMELWEQTDQSYALTMYWVATPCIIEHKGIDVPLEAVLAPLWAFNVLGSVLTQYEQDNPQCKVVHYRTDNLAEFVNWYLSQGKYREDLKQPRTLTYWFEPSGNKMQKGELVEWRKKLVEVGKIEQIGFDHETFNPRATVEGFVKWGKHTATMNGYDSSILMGVLDDVPQCLNVRVDITNKEGETAQIKLYNDGKEKSANVDVKVQQVCTF